MKGKRNIIWKIVLILAILFPHFHVASGTCPYQYPGTPQDTSYLRQQLYNGKVWRLRYAKIVGHEFFLTKTLSDGSVTINSRVFTNQLLWYDIFNDKLVLMVSPGLFVELNSENAGEFIINYPNSSYRFMNFGEMGYCHILYEGKAMLVKKYVKSIRYLTDSGIDTFEENEFNYVVTDGRFTRLRSKRDLLNALAVKKEEIRKFMRKKGIWVNKKEIESLIPVFQFYDSL